MEKKFKLTGNLAIQVLNAPDDFPVTSVNAAPFDRVLAFVYSVNEMVDTVRQIIKEDQLQEGAYLFLLYPKKGNKQFDTYIGRDDIFPAFEMDEEKYVFGSAVKFASLQSLDDTYSILSLKKQTKKTKRTASSQRVGDYVAYIPKLTEYLADKKEALALFESLTPGYQKDWARYVFSAKKEETQQQRLVEMADLLTQGYKTKEHYRKAQK
ncbi:YdeI/OmpD-associated family protein [Lysinibacillus odysseyi]|nr:YdeI/OmpD-associated family protein [Lysinibacillus odysseyi]